MLRQPLMVVPKCQDIIQFGRKFAATNASRDALGFVCVLCTRRLPHATSALVNVRHNTWPGDDDHQSQPVANASAACTVPLAVATVYFGKHLLKRTNIHKSKKCIRSSMHLYCRCTPLRWNCRKCRIHRLLTNLLPLFLACHFCHHYMKRDWGLQLVSESETLWLYIVVTFFLFKQYRDERSDSRLGSLTLRIGRR